jgi:hypothetical protein
VFDREGAVLAAVEGSIDFVAIGGVGNDFSGNDVKVFVEGSEADQESLIRILYFHLL